MRKNILLESYLASNSLVQHQVESFNRFVEQDLQKIIDQQATIEPSVEGFALKLGKVRLDKPSIIEADSSRRSILPNEAKLRNLTYASPMFLEFVPVIRGIEKEASYGEVFIGEMPIVVRSNLCHFRMLTKGQLIENGEDPDDPGGYFVIKGTERVLIGLEDLAPNRIITSKEKAGAETTSKVFSTAPGFRARTVVSRNQNGIFNVEFPTLHKAVEMVLVLRALGIQVSEMLAASEDVLAFKNDMMLNIELSEAREMGPSDALLELGKLSAPGQAKEYQIKRAETQLDTYLLPHIGTKPSDRKEKGKYVLQMAQPFKHSRGQACAAGRQGPLLEQEGEVRGPAHGGAVRICVQVLREGRQVPDREGQRERQEAEHTYDNKPGDDNREDFLRDGHRDMGRGPDRGLAGA